MKIQNAIVLKNHMPYRQTVALLDARLGHISGRLFQEDLSVGSLITYELETLHHRSIIKNIELVDMPFALAKHDMLFLHHLLELCYVFIPEGAFAEGVYELLCFVFARPILTQEQKKKILCVLCVLLDLYVDDALPYGAYMHELAQEPLEAMIEKTIDTNIAKNISRWLYQCISMQMRAQQLRTIHFLNEIL